MNIRTGKTSYEGQEGQVARVVNAAIGGVIALGLLALVATAPGEKSMVPAAQAAQGAVVEAGYFPAHFPAPEGAPEPHAQAF